MRFISGETATLMAFPGKLLGYSAAAMESRISNRRKS